MPRSVQKRRFAGGHAALATYGVTGSSLHPAVLFHRLQSLQRQCRNMVIWGGGIMVVTVISCFSLLPCYRALPRFPVNLSRVRVRVWR